MRSWNILVYWCICVSVYTFVHGCVNVRSDEDDIVTEEELQKKKVSYLIRPLNENDRKRIIRKCNIKDVHGVYVGYVVNNSYGYHSGLKIRDIIIEFQGMKIKQIRDVQMVESRLRPQDEINYLVLRNCKYISLDGVFK